MASVVCAKCGSDNVSVELHVKDGGYTAQGECHDCGWKDLPIKGDDPDLVCEVASREFSTKLDFEEEGLPTLKELADDISMLLKYICESNQDCVSCPMHATYAKKPTSVTDEGYISIRTRIGMQCVWQDALTCEERLRNVYSRLPEGLSF